jgi:hypothetical protein
VRNEDDGNTCGGAGAGAGAGAGEVEKWSLKNRMGTEMGEEGVTDGGGYTNSVVEHAVGEVHNRMLKGVGVDTTRTCMAQEAVAVAVRMKEKEKLRIELVRRKWMVRMMQVVQVVARNSPSPTMMMKGMRMPDESPSSMWLLMLLLL